MLNIGTKIKELRKERKLTLAQVAGDRLSKGMLSLIENGKAQPSMESLQHIANQLDIGVSELMQGKDDEKIRSLFLEVEQLRAQLNKEFNKTKYNEKCEEILHLIEPLVEEDMLNGSNYEEVRLVEIYSRVRYLLKIDTSITPFLNVIKMYEQIHAYSKIISGYCRICAIKFEQHLYEEALDYLLEGEKYITRYEGLIDELEKLDLYYNITVVYSALNNEQKTEQYLEKALKIAKEKKILYRLNDFYRFLFVIHCSKGDAEKSRYYLKKISAFTEILEEPAEAVIEQLLNLVYMNQIEKDYEMVIRLKMEETPITEEYLSPLKVFLHGEYAYAYWHLKQHDEAKKELETLKLTEIHHHPIDLVRIYRAFAIRALCYLQEGDIENAKRDILYAVDGCKDFSETPEKRFILDAYEEVLGK
ncbi:transcriptional regulator [Solibacillus sp. R5-41]|uniref:helix-turn-helix domain-containing protein n=1 Tax=Solibacillus sp. R5-41 TaxID=2048654 RepID=UPI000C1285D2|nr:helix-turn-helix domain-containing protein [Solibacillus sp. R5-41]ATP39816.1 transcriptional regulator [Solibacillus sp. R5-41]